MFKTLMLIIVFTIILATLILLIIKSKFSEVVDREYSKSVNFLAKHKLFAVLLCHGGFHIIVIIICFIIISLIYTQIMDNNEARFNQMIYTFYGDTLNNYTLSNIQFKKDIAPRPGNFFNEKDIEFRCGYKKSSNYDANRKIKDVIPTDTSFYDLVTKIEYVTINDRNDTIKNKKKYQYIKHPNTNLMYIEKNEQRTNHQRFYYTYSPLNDTIHVFRRQTNANDPLKEWASDNPYHCMWIGFNFKCKPELDTTSEIRIIYNKIEYNNTIEGVRQPVTLDNILPQPTSLSLTEIVYRGKQLENVVKQGGIYITGIDPERKRHVDKWDVILSVLIGTIAAFIIDVAVQLILKWKNLKSKG